MRFAQLVMGPAGSGKSTYCATLVKHCEDRQRIVRVVNLDPAAEYFDYQPTIDIRELIHLDDVMEEDLHYGPNGGLIFCMEYLVENFDWLKEQLGEDTDDYFIFDCPGQIELFTHLDTFRRLTDLLQSWEFRICAVYLIDSQFMIEASKFLSGVMTALSTMVNLEISHLNVLTKIDLLNKRARKQINRFLEPDVHLLLEEEQGMTKWGQKYFKLSKAIGSLIDDYSLVKFMPFDYKNEDSIQEVLITIDNAIQYGEDLEVKVKDFYEEDSDDDDNGKCYS